MKKYKVLIIEDEIILAHTISSFLKRKSIEIVGIAINYEESIELLKSKKPDLVLIDICLNGKMTGIDIAHYIKKFMDIPFIFISSQNNSQIIETAKTTHPSGYLHKPIHKKTLYSTIQISLHNHNQREIYELNKEEKNEIIFLSNGSKKISLQVKDIKFIKAEHIYINIHMNSTSYPLVLRKSLRSIKEILPETSFIQPNRSCIINTNYINSWDRKSIKVGETAMTISRNNKGVIYKKLLDFNLAAG